MMTNRCDRCGAEFKNWADYNKHVYNFKHTYKQMEPMKKAAIVARVERSMSAFLVGYGIPKPINAPTKLIIERFEPMKLIEPNWLG